MKTLNIGDGIVKSRGTMQILKEDYLDRQPCWYANFENDLDDREECAWRVGVKSEESKEYTFKVSKAGDVENKEFWDFITSSECAIELINRFRIGGENSVIKWVKAGCPHGR